MIYQINNVDVQTSTLQGALIVCWSFNGDFALVQTNTPIIDITVIEEFSDNELENVLKLPLWQQPCPAC
jgi:uncharacterized protein YkvS